ncbi:MAG: Coenzyme F420 hydrogenase/dehydrogenase, beta subunit C-terminal domain [Halioglobus sp.]|nr:Coenzyme F420 hydrogenase/dehydrogenase, beta subunit C-terminal domain [Halioglobus sp.]
MAQATTIDDVIDQHLCMGCGTCAAKRPDVVHMADTIAHGRRPIIASDLSEVEAESLAISCPGQSICSVNTSHEIGAQTNSYDHAAWGPVLEVWEGYATDPELRYSGASGGVVSALTLFCIEGEDFTGAIQVRARPDAPLLNESIISRSRGDVLSATASRYAPASPCERLADIQGSNVPHVFVGKPCDVAGATMLADENEEIENAIGLSISIFCAGTPSLAGTQELLQSLGFGPEDILNEVRYRGRGWPGKMFAIYRKATGKTVRASTSYEEGWGSVLQKHTQWRCRLCADHLGDHADLSVGDPWYRPIAPGDEGQSLVVVRTERGRHILKKAIKAGAVVMTPRSISTLAASQPNLGRAKGAVFGRALTARLMGAYAPTYPGMRLSRVWWHELTLSEKVKSVFGTAKRVVLKGLLRPEGAEVLDEISNGD